MESGLTIESCACVQVGASYHVWSPSLREALPCERENGNEKDPYMVGALQSDRLSS